MKQASTENSPVSHWQSYEICARSFQCAQKWRAHFKPWTFWPSGFMLAAMESNSLYFASRLPLMLELGFREEALPSLKEYIDLLWTSNEELNLISRKMPFTELIDNHLIDCLLPLNLFPEGIREAGDFGSGGGLPGVVYALQFPNTRYRLFEKSPKKREFLERCRKIATNLAVEAEIPQDLGAVEIVSARAFKPLDVILDMSRKFYGRGRYFLLKGRREKIDEEFRLAQKKFNDLRLDIHELKSPLMEVERHVVIIG